MGLLSKIISIPAVSRLVLERMKKNAFKPYQIPLEKALEKQDRMLEVKFKRMEGTEIGRKLGVHKDTRPQDLPVTDYSFYEPFYSNPSSSAFMYPLEDYWKVKTSGTAGTEKWFMIPEKKILNTFRQTTLPGFLAVFHDGEKVTLELGDTFYLNTAPGPFIGGAIFSTISKDRANPFFKFVPDINLPYKTKIEYFVLNHEKIDGAIMLASTLVSQIMPAIGKPIKLKGLLVLDTAVAEVHFDEITKFVGTTPKSGYASTETISAFIPSVEHPLGFLFDWRRGMFEFIPLKNGEAKQGEAIPINEVKVGETYQFIWTDFDYELTRYNTKDSFACIAKGDNILGTDYPVFKFHTRTEKTISLQNFTRISEDELLRAFKEGVVPFVEFTARVEIEKGLEYLAIYVEHTGDITDEELQRIIHKKLYEMDRDYRDLVDFFEYIPIKIHTVPRGVFAKYLQGKLQHAVIPKINRIKMRKEEFEELIQLMKKH